MAPKTDQFEVEKKSWSELLNHARTWRNFSRKGLGVTLHHFYVCTDMCGTDRVLALGGSGQSPQQTIYTAPLTRSPLIAGASHLTLSPYLEGSTSKGPPPAELAALCERQRTSLASGICSYQFNPSTGALLYSDSSQLFLIQGEETREVGAGVAGCPLNALLCPVDNSIVAFVANSNVHIDRGGKIIYSTSAEKDITNGFPSFIAQEELDRFTGMWWSPGPEKMLLYERIDESAVPDLQFACPGRPPSPPMKYPVAGAPNAFSTLRLISLQDERATDNELSVDLKTIYPWYEYLARVGWVPDGSAIWATLMSRLQDRRALILIPKELFCEPGAPQTAHIITLHTQKSDSWINVDNLTHFLPSAEGLITFFHSVIRNDNTHLSLFKAKLQDNHRVSFIQEIPVTSGEWSIPKASGLHVDIKRNHVYFVANKHHPTDTNLCVTAFGSFCEPRILTEKGLSYRVERGVETECDMHIDEEIGFVCWESGLRFPPRCVFYKIRHVSHDPLPFAQLQHILQLPHSALLNEQPVLNNIAEIRPIEYPELIEYCSANSGRKHYGLLLRPMGAVDKLRHPVIHVVYGGPGVQLVRNVWTIWVNYQKFTSLGYAVVLVDGRGSANRGMSFESAIKHQLGTVEIDDQVEGLREVAMRAGGLLDLNRVAVMGWSYGGYMALLCLAKCPTVYRAAIAGGAVTCWTLYDTAYTERYLGLPSEPIYKNASVLSYVSQLPNEADRLLIVHGLIDENVHFTHTERLVESLITAGKPYQLQVFPSERHGVRSPDASEFHDAVMFSFLSKALAAV